MKKYRKKPVVVEAVQFISERKWPDCVVGLWVDPVGNKHYSDSTKDFFMNDVVCYVDYIPIVRTLEGDMKVNERDWIIRGIKGEFYPCKPDIFEATYEEVTG